MKMIHKDQVPEIRFAFFGSSSFSIYVLDELEKSGFIPSCVVTTPDKPQGRKLVITPNPVKVWAQTRSIPIYHPAKLGDPSVVAALRAENCEVYIVASYGRIIPASIINLPPHQTLNIHPSLLPKYRGASPLQSAILDDSKQTGISIMRINEKMDEGPVIAQKEITIAEWPTYEVFERQMAREGATLLASILPGWVAGTISEHDQDPQAATYTRKIAKGDAEIEIPGTDPYFTFRKIQAYHEWPQAYFFITHRDKQMRVKVTAASFQGGNLIIEKVIPEGAREMTYKDFLSGYGPRELQ